MDRAIDRRARLSFEPWVHQALASALATAGLAALLVARGARSAEPRARAACVAALGAYAATHAFLGLVTSAFALVQGRRGFVSARRSLGVDVAATWQLCTALGGALALTLAYQLEAFAR